MEPPPPTEPPRLPVDLLLEIVALVDVTTAIRCAATSTVLRNALLDPGLHLRAATRSGGFDPARLVAVSYSSPDYGGDGVVQLRRPRRARFDTSLLRSFNAVSSRDGLLVLFRDEPGEPRQLRVCNAFTGGVTELPHMDVLDHEFYGGIYRPALLAVGAAGASFELLVMDPHFRLQTFSYSKDGGGACGAVREVASLPEHEVVKPYALQTTPLVVGRAVHYLCNSRSGHDELRPSDDMFVLAVHADEARAAAIELPDGWLGHGGGIAADSCCLGVTAGGRLSVLVADAGAVRVWALSPEPEEGWSPRATIDRRRIGEQVAPGLKKIENVAFQGFGERSGAALLRIDMVGLVLLDLETEKAVLLRGCSERDRRRYQYERAWLHEVDLASLLQSMKAMKGIGEGRRR
ncbi:unnamed protein product [Urochloa humidicola]